jgi:hypothetical protein
VRARRDKTDAELIEAVRRAAQARLTPDAAEAAVGEAVVNTSRNLPLEALRRVDLIADEASGQQTLSREGARAVAYWERPIESKDPRMVGMIWRADGAVEVFFGVVLPP